LEALTFVNYNLFVNILLSVFHSPETSKKEKKEKKRKGKKENNDQ